MQIYEIIANLFILSVSMVGISISSFLIYITGDVILEKIGIDGYTRAALIAIVIITLTILIR